MDYLPVVILVVSTLIAMKYWLGAVEQHRQLTFQKLRREQQQAEQASAAKVAAEESASKPVAKPASRQAA
ncbi:MAG: hypothetical protein C0478_18905 [Planctomyces sp.]|nr:hypothetical protein [Planctomyces sp.]